ncbi:MAG: solute carrier family 23 protein [Bacteroidota bacterium]
MATKPANLIYGVDDKPPWKTAFVLGLQHVFSMSSCLFIPVLIAQEIGGGFDVIQSLVCFSMIAGGLGTVLQSLRKGPVGSGYLCPHLVGPSYLSVSIQAAGMGGLPLMHGMTLITGLFEVLFSRVVHRLRSLFPTEITGLVVLMIAVGLIPLGASKFVGIDYAGDSINTKELFVALITLFTMIGFNIWGKGKLRLFCVLIGLGIGYIISAITGVISHDDYNVVLNAPWFSLPGKGVKMFSYQFDWGLVIPFFIVSLCSSLKSIGNLITCQKINDEKWSRPDMKNIGKGLFADGLSVTIAGALGGTATDTSASNVGLSVATSATSRRIGYFAGFIFTGIAFIPKIASIFSIMPSSIMGAIVIFVTSFMVISGIQIIQSCKLDTRKTFVIGLSFIFGLSAIILPDLYSRLPSWLSPVFSSSLTLATMLAIILNQIFHIGAKKNEKDQKEKEIEEMSV